GGPAAELAQIPHHRENRTLQKGSSPRITRTDTDKNKNLLDSISIRVYPFYERSISMRGAQIFTANPHPGSSVRLQPAPKNWRSSTTGFSPWISRMDTDGKKPSNLHSDPCC